MRGFFTFVIALGALVMASQIMAFENSMYKDLDESQNAVILHQEFTKDSYKFERYFRFIMTRSKSVLQACGTLAYYSHLLPGKIKVGYVNPGNYEYNDALNLIYELKTLLADKKTACQNFLAYENGAFMVKDTSTDIDFGKVAGLRVAFVYETARGDHNSVTLIPEGSTYEGAA